MADMIAKRCSFTGRDRRRGCAHLLGGLLLAVGWAISASVAASDARDRAPAPVPTEVSIPVTGFSDPALEVFDTVILEALREHDLPGAVFGLMKDGEILVQRGYGWCDEARTKPMPHDAMLRIASVSKHITIAAVRELIRGGRLSLEDRAFDVGHPGGGVLPVAPFPHLGDERIGAITIDDLIHHRGGWKRSEAGDLTYREVEIARAMDAHHPPGREKTLRWILGQPLQFAPGAEREYSNVGCLALGLIVEHVTGQELMDVIHESVLAPIGIARSEHDLGRTRREDANGREPFYDCGRTGRSVFAPDAEPTAYAYGGWHQEARVGQGGQISTTRTLLLLLDNRWVNGPNIGERRDPHARGRWKWNHGGALPGTLATARQRGDRIHFAVILNRRKPGDASFTDQLRGAIDHVIDSGAIVWPVKAAPPPQAE